MKIFEKTVFSIVFILVIVGVAMSHSNREWFESFYVREDGPIEWLTVIALLCGAFLCWYRANILKPFRSNIFIASLIFLGMLFLFGAGEEISWGQRIIGVKSPSFFIENNSQMETNFHNPSKHRLDRS